MASTRKRGAALRAEATQMADVFATDPRQSRADSLLAMLKMSGASKRQIAEAEALVAQAKATGHPNAQPKKLTTVIISTSGGAPGLEYDIDLTGCKSPKEAADRIAAERGFAGRRHRFWDVGGSRGKGYVARWERKADRVLITARF